MLHWLRDAQLGVSSPRARTVPPPGWSSTLVKRLRLERTLEGHDGCERWGFWWCCRLAGAALRDGG